MLLARERRVSMAADWMIEAVRYYRGVNFFSTYSALSDEELAKGADA